MNNQEIQNELLQVQKEISELPIGYISKKTINGKTKQYLQWTENGKKKSKYVDDELAEELRRSRHLIRSCSEALSREKRARKKGNARFQNRCNARRKLEKLRSDSRKLQKEKSLT